MKRVVPIEFKKYFWDVTFEELNVKKDKKYIIPRLYCYGNLHALKWVNTTYSKEEIREVAKKCRNLNPIVANYLRQQCNLEKEEMAYYKNVAQNNFEYWRVN